MKLLVGKIFIRKILYRRLRDGDVNVMVAIIGGEVVVVEVVDEGYLIEVEVEVVED